MHLGENCSCLPTNLNLTSWKMWCENLKNVTVVALLEEPKKASLLSTLQQSLEMKQHHFSNGGPINQMEDRCSNVSKSIPFKVSQYFSIFHIVSNDYILSKKSNWWKHFENSHFGVKIQIHILVILGNEYSYNDVECSIPKCSACLLPQKNIFEFRGQLPENFGRRYVVHFQGNSLEMRDVKGSHMKWVNSSWSLNGAHVSQSYIITHLLPTLGNQVWKDQNGKQHQLKLTQVSSVSKQKR